MNKAGMLLDLVYFGSGFFWNQKHQLRARFIKPIAEQNDGKHSFIITYLLIGSDLLSRSVNVYHAIYYTSVVKHGTSTVKQLLPHRCKAMGDIYNESYRKLIVDKKNCI